MPRSLPSLGAHGLLLGLGAAALLGFAAPVASAATTTVFSAPVRQSSLPSLRINSGSEQIVTNAVGDELASWVEVEGWFNPAAPLTVGPHRFFSYRVAGGQWAPKVEVDVTENPGTPTRIALTGDGAVTVLSNVALDGNRIGLQARTGDVRQPQSQWKVQSFEVPGKSIRDARVLSGTGSITGLFYTAVDPSFNESDVGSATPYVTQRRGTDPFPTPEALVGAASTVINAAMSSRGDLAVTWVEPPLSRAVVRVVTRPFGGTASPVRELTPGVRRSIPYSVVATPGGGAVVAWEETTRTPAGDDAYAGHARRVSAAGALGPDQAITEVSTRQTIAPMLAADDAGRVSAAWSYWGGNLGDGPSLTYVTEIADAPPGGPFGAAKTVSTAEAEMVDSIVSDPTGGVLLATGIGLDVTLRYRPAGKPDFDQPVIVLPGNVHRVAAGASGPGRFSTMSIAPDPRRVNGETMLLTRRSSLVAAGATDTTPPKTAMGTAVQSAKDAAGHSTIAVPYTINEGSNVTAILARKQPGVVSNGTCVAPPASVPPSAIPCLRRVTVATTPTKWSAKFSGTLTFATAPAPGAYILTVTAKDAAGNQGAAATTIAVN